MHLNDFCWFRSQECLILFWTKLENSGHSEWGLRFLGGFLIKKVDYYTSHHMAYVIIRRSTGSFLLFWGKICINMWFSKDTQKLFFLFKDSLLLQIHQYDKWLRKRHTLFQKLLRPFRFQCTPPRTPRISGLKSQVLKPIFLT